MRYKLLGHTGIRVSELCLGTMTFGESWGWGASEAESARILETYAEAGGNFIDTANVYTDGQSEQIVGKLLAADRDHWVLATKYGLSTRPDDPNAGGAHRKNLRQALEASLRRLGTDHVDVFWLHLWDAFTPVDEVMHALDDVVRTGKALAVGVSDTPAWVVSRGNTLAELRGWSRFAGLQVPYSLVERTPERELLPMAKADAMTVTTWGALGSGLLTGKYGTGRPSPANSRIADQAGMADLMLNERNLAIADVVNDVADGRGVTPGLVAIAWVRAQQHRASIVPVLGARTRAQLEANLQVLTIELTAEELDRLDTASRVEPGFPHDFVGRELAYGSTLDRIDDPAGRTAPWTAA